MSKRPGRREFKRGILAYRGDALGGAHHRSPGLRHPLLDDAANCFVVIEEERGDVAAGGAVSVEPFSRPEPMRPRRRDPADRWVAPIVRDLVTAQARALAHLRYADVRLEVTEGKFAAAENGEAKSSGDDSPRASASASSPGAA